MKAVCPRLEPARQVTALGSSGETATTTRRRVAA